MIKFKICIKFRLRANPSPCRRVFLLTLFPHTYQHGAKTGAMVGMGDFANEHCGLVCLLRVYFVAGKTGQECCGREGREFAAVAAFCCCGEGKVEKLGDVLGHMAIK